MKWFLSQIRWFALQTFTKERKEIVPISLNKEVGWDNETPLIDMIEDKSFISCLDTLIVSSLPDYLRVYSETNNGQFERNAYSLFLSRLSQETKSDFAARVGVCCSAITAWIYKLERLIKNYFEMTPTLC